MVDRISEGDGGPDDVDASLCRLLLMFCRAEDSALSSDELTVPADTSELNVVSNKLSGDWVLNEEMEVMGRSRKKMARSRRPGRLTKPCLAQPNLFPSIACSGTETFGNKSRRLVLAAGPYK
jgi:hypothetical protein